MSVAYWAQWSYAEIMSMHGADLNRYQDDDHDDCHIDKEEVEKHRCLGCMNCLGLSWRDFM